MIDELIDLIDERICLAKECNKCDIYKKESEKYKRRYELAKSGLTKEERDTLIELLINEQIKHMIPNDKYQSDEYVALEELKAKIKVI